MSFHLDWLGQTTDRNTDTIDNLASVEGPIVFGPIVFCLVFHCEQSVS